nr:zinc finger, CCHC-type, retrotransposon Gag domain protein [Tanacetum cinerariifolium]
VTTRNNPNVIVPNFEAMINAAVANALPNLMTTLRTQITNDIRNGAGPSGGGGGDVIPHGIHVWIERFTKLKPLTFRSAATPAEVEDWITHMEKLFQVLGCLDNFKTRLGAFKLEGDALSWYFPASEQQRHEHEYGSICQLDRESFGEYMERFTRLASFVGAAIGDVQRQARHLKWGLKKWVLDRIVNTDYTNVTQVAAAARNIELLHESGNSNKRDRDGNRVQNIGQGQQEIRGRYDQGQHVYRGRQDQSVEYRGRQDQGYDLKRQDFQGQDQRSAGRNGNDCQGQDYDTNIQYHPSKDNVVADALSQKSGMIACFNFRILHDFEHLDVELCVRDSGGYWASMRIESNLMLQIKEAQKDDNELWAIVQNVEDGKHTKFSVDDDGVVWFENRLCVPSDQALREK